MKIPNFIVGKKQIILASLTLFLGLAIYVNYAMNTNGDEIKTTKVVNTKSSNYGVADLDRLTSRDEAAQTLETIMSGGDSTDEEKEVASEKAVSISQLIESESKIENLIKAAGYEDCVVYLDGTSANIVVKSDGLKTAQAAQIKDILLGEVDVANENIKIFDVK